MSNTVTDGILDWQNDSDGNDTNLPIPATNIGIATSGDLTGEFRRIKSELRGDSLLKSWERWKGLLSNTTLTPIAFTFSNLTTFLVNDNFVTASRAVATSGRRVRAIQAGSTLYGTINQATYAAPNTQVTVVWDSGGLDATLNEVQFGLEPNSLQVAVIIPVGSVMLFRANAAPTGWVRLVDAYYDDRMIRVVTGAPADPGAWPISGLTSGHQHSLNNHTHYDDHQHDLSNHVHDQEGHTHTIPDSGQTSEGHLGNQYAMGGDVQSGGPNIPNTGGPSPNGTGAKNSGNNTLGPSINATSIDVALVASDGTWRPASLDFLICYKS